MNIIDIVAIIILAVTVFLGYEKGLVGVAFRLVTFLAAIIITAILYNPVSNLVIQNTQIDENIENTIINNVGEAQELKITGVEYIDNYIQEAKDTSVNAVAHDIAISITKVITAIVLFIAIKLISYIFYKFSEALAELPIIKQFNKAGGILYGILEGALIIYIIIMVFTIIAPMINNMNILTYINGSFIGRIIL